jgi:bacteriocin-like protein
MKSEKLNPKSLMEQISSSFTTLSTSELQKIVGGGVYVWKKVNGVLMLVRIK